MNGDDSRLRPKELQDRIRLLEAAAEGTLEALPCPRCGQPSVSVWFTHPAPDLYRTWFVCDACDFKMRAQNTGRPAHYSAERDRTAQAATDPSLLATDHRS